MSRNDPLSLATGFADRMARSTTIAQLEAIGQEIRGVLGEVTELIKWREWLLDIYSSNEIRLNMPDLPIEDGLNAAGKKALKKGELYEKESD